MGSSPTRNQTRVPCFRKQILNHCTTREAPSMCFNVFLMKVWRRKGKFMASLRETCKQEKSEAIFKVSKGKKNLEFYVWQNYPSKVKKKYFLRQKLRALVTRTSVSQEMLENFQRRVRKVSGRAGEVSRGAAAGGCCHWILPTSYVTAGPSRSPQASAWPEHSHYRRSQVGVRRPVIPTGTATGAVQVPERWCAPHRT